MFRNIRDSKYEQLIDPMLMGADDMSSVMAEPGLVVVLAPNDAARNALVRSVLMSCKDLCNAHAHDMIERETDEAHPMYGVARTLSSGRQEKVKVIADLIEAQGVALPAPPALIAVTNVKACHSRFMTSLECAHERNLRVIVSTNSLDAFDDLSGNHANLHLRAIVMRSPTVSGVLGVSTAWGSPSHSMKHATDLPDTLLVLPPLPKGEEAVSPRVHNLILPDEEDDTTPPAITTESWFSSWFSSWTDAQDRWAACVQRASALHE